MREILFRGKRKDNGEWVQGDSLIHSMYKKGDVCIGVIEGLECWREFDNEIDEMLQGRFKDDKMLYEQKEIVKNGHNRHGNTAKEFT